MDNQKSYGDYQDEAEDKWNRGAEKHESNRKEFNHKKMKKKEKIRVSEYARLVGQSPSWVYEKIANKEMEAEMIGGSMHVDYPKEELIKFKPVK